MNIKITRLENEYEEVMIEMEGSPAREAALNRYEKLVSKGYLRSCWDPKLKEEAQDQ